MKRIDIGISVVLCALLLAGCNKPSVKSVVIPPQPVATNAPVAPVAPQLPLLPETVATIRGSEMLPVKAPQTGYLVRQAYKDGAPVAAGDLLFLLDPRTAHEGAPTNKSALVRIVSPEAGYPGEAWHGPGDWVDPNMELTELARIDEVVAELSVPDALARQFEAYFDRLAHDRGVHKDFELILPDGHLYPERGYAAAGTMPSDGTIHSLSIQFPNPGHVLKPGDLVKVRSVPR